MAKSKNVSQSDEGSEVKVQTARPIQVTDSDIEESREGKLYLLEAYKEFDEGDIYLTGKHNGYDFIVDADGDAFFLEDGEWVERDSPISTGTSDQEDE